LVKCTRGPKIGVQIANKQRISTSKPFSPTNVSLGAKIFTGLSLAVLPHLKCVDFIFGLPANKELNMHSQPSNDLVLIGDTPFQYDLQPRRVSCLLDDSSKIRKIIPNKVVRNKHIESEFSLVSFHFAEELEPIKTDFGPELDT
jgi:hypothetical protein